MYAATLHLLGNHSDADDATQEAFVRAYRGLASFDQRADFFTWLYRIAINTALNLLRSGKRAGALATKSQTEADHVGGRPEALGKLSASPQTHVERTDEALRVFAAIGALSETLRVTLVLATIEELPHRQIAEILEIPEGTVAWRVNEARRVLRAKLAEPDAPPVAQPAQPAQGRR